MQKLADISVFEGLQRGAHAQMNIPSEMSVFNDYSEAEKQERTARIEQEIEDIKRETNKLYYDARNARQQMEAEKKAAFSELGAVAQRAGWDENQKQDYWRKYDEILLQEHEEKYFWANKEMKDRADALRGRVKEIRGNDPDGRFAIPCFAIEDKLDKFEMQIKSTMSKKPVERKTLSNMSAFQ